MTKIYYFTTSVCLDYKIKPKIAFGTSLFFHTCKIQLYIFRENGPDMLSLYTQLEYGLRGYRQPVSRQPSAVSERIYISRQPSAVSERSLTADG